VPVGMPRGTVSPTVLITHLGDGFHPISGGVRKGQPLPAIPIAADIEIYDTC
jgi:hypothetical protein